jgi:hypothetical protein
VLGASIGVLQTRRRPSASPHDNGARATSPQSSPSAGDGSNPIRALASLITNAITKPASRPTPGPSPGAVAPQGECPAPRTCPRYVLSGDVPVGQAPRWPQTRGVGVIHYLINPRGALTMLDDAHVVAAIRAAFATWQTMVPTVRFVYDGTTAALPIGGDGQNVVGFGDLTSGNHLGNAIVTRSGGTIVEADMVLATGRTVTGPGGPAVIGWTWRPCGTDRVPCTDLRGCAQAAAVLRCEHDLQDAATHEVGHWLWLGDLHSAQDVAMTMYGSIGAGSGEVFVSERHKVTLGLGDVIGARALYPCACAAPKVITP